MQIVIDIPEDVYKRTVFYREFRDLNDCVTTIKALENGKPLPKGHGDLITKEQAIELVEFYEMNPQHFDFVSLIDNIKDLPSVNPQKSGWIPVSERLPEYGGNYLVTIAFDLGDKEPVREVRKDYFCIMSKKWLYEDENIIAWMPSPEPYKSESEDNG